MMAATLSLGASAHGRSTPSGPLVQIVGVRVPAAMPRSALLHAVRRDAWTQVWVCAANTSLRGSMQFRLRRGENSARVELVEPVSSAQRSAAQCVVSALERVHLPALEIEPAGGAMVEFELVFRGRRMPGPLLLAPLVIEWGPGARR